MLYYPRSNLADCRSLPTLTTVTEAFGIQEVYGESFQKLALFMKDIGGGETMDGDQGTRYHCNVNFTFPYHRNITYMRDLVKALN